MEVAMSRGPVKPNKTGLAKPSDVVYTRPEVALKIVDYFKPQFEHDDFFLDPCYGAGAFLDLLPPNKIGLEIQDGLDFFQFKDHAVDWVITNPPWSLYELFLLHSFEVSDNVVFLVDLVKVFKNTRLEDKISKYGGIKEIVHMGTGYRLGFKLGFPVGCIHYQKYHWSGVIKYSRL
jgi:hypothetical protein